FLSLLRPYPARVLIFILVLFFFPATSLLLDFLSFPTRRSSDLFLINVPVTIIAFVAGRFVLPSSRDPEAPRLDLVGAALSVAGRSEEHTSELQSLAYLVCRRLLEKKKSITLENSAPDEKRQCDS